VVIPKERPELTKAVLLWVYDRVLDAGVAPIDQYDCDQIDRARKIAYSELKRLGLLDEIGNPTKEGKRLLGLV